MLSFDCNGCLQKVTKATQAGIKAHLRGCGVLDMHCNFCSYTTRTHAALKKHIRRKHKDHKEKEVPITVRHAVTHEVVQRLMSLQSKKPPPGPR